MDDRHRPLDGSVLLPAQKQRHAGNMHEISLPGRNGRVTLIGLAFVVFDDRLLPIPFLHVLQLLLQTRAVCNHARILSHVRPFSGVVVLVGRHLHHDGVSL